MSKNEVKVIDLRDLFPILKTKVNGNPFVFLDSASTAQSPQSVIDAIVEYYKTYKSNVGRGIYTFAERATLQVQNTREKIAKFIGAKKEEIVFTSGTTAGINLVVDIWAQHNIMQGDEIIVSEIEHHSNFVPWQQIALSKGVILKIIPVNQYGVIDIELLKSYLSPKTKLVAIIHQSNVLGTTNDVAAIVQAAHTVGAKVLIDAAQSIAHQKINVKKIDCDFLVFSGHKLFGPTGVGVLFIKQNLFDQCRIHNFGGGMVYSVSQDYTEVKAMPYCLEAGTQPVAQIIGLGAAIDFVNKHIDYHLMQKHETRLVRQFIHGIVNIPGIKLISSMPQADQQSNIVTFISDIYHAHDIAAYLDSFGIAVRAGHHCVQPYHTKLGINASVRVSFSVYNTNQEVTFFIECLKTLFV